MSHLDAKEVLRKGHDIVSKIQNSAYRVVKVAKKQDSRGAKFYAFGSPGCDDNYLSRYQQQIICERNMKTFFKQFLKVDTTGITENWVNIKAILDGKDKHSNMSTYIVK